MRYTVTWHSPAERRLAELWLAAVDKSAVRSAADEGERKFASRPSHVGREIEGAIRELVEPPLSFLYIVREEDRIVEVAGVKYVFPDAP